jgi:hypothetical protein
MNAKSLAREDAAVVTLDDEARGLLQKCREMLEHLHLAERKFQADCQIIDHDFAELAQLNRALSEQKSNLCH